MPSVRGSPAPIRAALLAPLLLAGCLHARGTADEPVVTSVSFDGVKAVEVNELQGKLATQPSGRFAWSEERRLDPDALAADRRRVAAFYRERGYYRAAVDDVELRPDGEGRVEVVFKIREGERVKVARLEVEGLDGAPEARARAGALALERGKGFTWAALDAGRAQLQSALGETGYATGKVTQQALVRGDEGSADVTYRVEPGPRLRFGQVSVSGTEVVPADKVAVQAARLVTPGDWFDERKLERIQAQVFQLGVFAGVRVNKGAPDLEKGEVPVEVSVREAPFHTVRAGPGIGFEPSRWDVNVQASWTHRNWLGDLRQLKLEARGGYAWIPNPTDPIRAGVVGKLGAELTQPGAFSAVLDLTTLVELEKTIDQTYDSNNAKLRFGTPWRPAPRWVLVPSYNLEIYRLSNVAGDAATLPEVQNCPGEVCVLSYLEQRVTWDGRDNPLLTTDGLFLSLAVQEGFPAGGQGYTYVKLLPEARWFRSLARGTVLAARARFGALIPVGETGPAPVVALFMAGGPASMRGYGTQRLSPMVYAEGNWVPTGGNGLLDGSLELRRTLAGNLAGVVSLDAGNVSGASGRPTEYLGVLEGIQLAVALGIRYRTPVGPLRADVGIRLPNDLRKDVPFSERFPAVPGDSGHREPIAVIHVALGEAF